MNRRENAALFARVEKKSLIVCVPVAAALPAHVTFDKYYIESHIFEPSPFVEFEYVSVNKKVVEIRDKKITTRKGYPERRLVSILGDESFYTSEPEPFRVLFIDSPLEGLARVRAAARFLVS